MAQRIKSFTQLKCWRVGSNELQMPDLWKEMISGTVAVEESKGISIWCELLGVKGIDRIFVFFPSWGRQAEILWNLCSHLLR